MTRRSTGPRPEPDGATPAAARADQLVAAVRDDPAQRLRLAAGFYEQRVGGRSIRAYRRAEVAFMRWQIRCGVLSPLGGDQPGSPWWRAVNESLLRDAVEADLLFNGGSGQASTTGVAHWLTFLHRPTPHAWYRAHNASIVDGYLRHRDLIAGGPLERFFMDVALLRVLYAHCLLIRRGWLWAGSPGWAPYSVILAVAPPTFSCPCRMCCPTCTRWRRPTSTPSWPTRTTSPASWITGSSRRASPTSTAPPPRT